MQSAATLYASDPLGVEGMGSVALPAGTVNAWGLDFDGQRVFLATLSRPAALHLLDANARRYGRRVFDGEGRCGPRDVLTWDGHVYVGCYVENRVVRVPRDFDGALGPEHEVAMPGGDGTRLTKIVRAGTHLVAIQARSTFLTLVPLDRWERPANHPDRNGDRQTGGRDRAHGVRAGAPRRRRPLAHRGGRAGRARALGGPAARRGGDDGARRGRRSRARAGPPLKWLSAHSPDKSAHAANARK
jgi:hypothetical protein